MTKIYFVASFFFLIFFQANSQQLNKLLKSLEKESNDTVRVHILSDLCFEYRFISQDSAIDFGNDAIHLASKLKYDKGLAQAYNDLGIIYADRADNEKANQLYDEALKIRFRLNDSLGVAAIYSKKGILYQKIGKYDSALSNQLRCLRIYESGNSELGISYTLNNIAILLFNKGDNEGSLEYHAKALEIRKRMDDKMGIATSMGNMGNIYFEEGQFQKALIHYKEGFDIIKLIDSKDHFASLANNISNSFIQLGELDSAKKYTQMSITTREEINDIKGLISSYHNLGKIFQSEGDSQMALSSFLNAQDLSKQHGLLSSIEEVSLTLMDYYDELGMNKKALEEARIHIKLKDSINNINVQKTLAELQTKYETEKKEQQIALQQYVIAEQKADNQRNIAIIFGLIVSMLFMVIVSLLLRSRTRKKQAILLQEAQIKLHETQIEAALNSQELERKRFARDLHDGFGQMISVLNLNLKSLEKGESDREEVFQNSSKVLDDMYKELKGICFNLMPETLIKNGVVDAIKEFGNRVNLTGKLILEVDTFGITERLNDLQEISIYRITQEWVNNILKYSDADKVTVSLTKDEEEITLLIEDNGSGFDKQKLIEGTGNGWKNMNSRANLIKGELELDTKLGAKGSTLIVNVPVKVIGVAPAQEIPA